MEDFVPEAPSFGMRGAPNVRYAVCREDRGSHRAAR